MLHPVDFVPFWSMLCGTEVSTLHKYVIPGSKSPPDVPQRWLPTPDCHFSSLMVCWPSVSTGWLYLDGLLTPVHWIKHHEVKLAPPLDRSLLFISTFCCYALLFLFPLISAVWNGSVHSSHVRDSWFQISAGCTTTLTSHTDLSLPFVAMPWCLLFPLIYAVCNGSVHSSQVRDSWVHISAGCTTTLTSHTDLLLLQLLTLNNDE
jgi:hypothetical protein